MTPDSAGDSSRSADAVLSVIVPCYNEARTIASLLDQVLAQRSVGEVIVVDDGSSDTSAKQVQAVADPRVKLLQQAFNMGKGAAIARGIQAATRPYLVIQDADLEYDPNEYEVLLQPLLDGRADVSFGSRFQGSGSRRVLYFWHAVGNRILTTASNTMTNLNLTDMETCYKMGRTEVMQSITLEEDRFGVEPEITAKLAQTGCTIYETGISYHGRTYDEGKKINWKDGVSAFRCIAKYSRRNRVSFPPADEIADVAMPAELVASLDSLDGADNYNAMIARLIEPWLGTRNCEVGSGIGTIANALLNNARVSGASGDRREFVVSDPDSDNVAKLNDRFGSTTNVSVRAGDLSTVLERPNEFDSIFMANVLEHIRDDRDAIAQCHEALTDDGNLILYVPAGRSLYSETDRAMGHYRRYTASSLRRSLAAAGMEPVEMHHVNAPGALAWWALTRRLGRQPTEASLVQTYDRYVVPVISKLENKVKPPFGQSLFCVARGASSVTP